MEVVTIGTGSRGNCYLLKENERTVVLDCGLNFKEITSNPNFPSFKDIDFVFVTHTHTDHNKSINNFKRAGCNIISYKNLKHCVEKQTIGDWDITTFPVAHNVINFGIVLKNKNSKETFCYVTDFYAMPRLEGVTFWLYEVNYIETYVDKMIEQNKELKHTNFNFHNSLEKAVDYFNSLETRPKQIICCHLSENNSIKQKILETMSKFADKVEIAHNWRK